MGHVALAHGGRHLRLGSEAGRGLRCAGGLDHDALFERLELGHGRIALRTGDGRYLAVRPDAGLGYGIYADDDLSVDAAFEEIRWPTGEVSLRSCHLTYVTVRPSGRVTVNRTEAGPQERFVMLSPTRAAMPDQRRPTRAAVVTTSRR